MPRPHRPTIEGKREKQEDLKERKGRLQREASERQRAWDDLTPNGRLKALAGRPGESKKQRARIEAEIAKDKAPKAAPAAAPVKAAEAPAAPVGKQKKSK